MTSIATGIGSMPGGSFVDSLQIVLGEVGDLPYVPELPDRGVGAEMIGRTLGLVKALGIDLQPAGWRLTDAAGVDHRRAASLLAQDLDSVEEAMHGRAETVKVQVAGPWTLAAAVERPRGDKVLGDFGARRDLAQALAEGVRDHVADIRRRLSGTTVVVQVDEPALPSILAGGVPTASGFHRHRSVSTADAAQAIEWLLSAVASTDTTTVLHCCASDVPFAVLRETSVAAVSFDVSLLTRAEYDDVAMWVDAGRTLWPGVVPAVEPAEPSSEVDLTKRLLTWWSALGFSDPDSIPAMTVTPTCGLAGASPAWARRALALSQQVAANLTVESA